MKQICSGVAFINNGFEEIIIPSIWGSQTFIEKAGGSEILDQMFNFTDKNNKSICLVPEITGIIQELFRENFFKTSSNPNYTRKLFYISRCYRYENPQLGRQREFTQLGVEIITTNEEQKNQFKKECIEILKQFLEMSKIEYKLVESVKRGLSYYVEDGFEVECNNLGTQKQIAGGGMYKEGVGFAIGLERLLLAKKGIII